MFGRISRYFLTNSLLLTLKRTSVRRLSTQYPACKQSTKKKKRKSCLTDLKHHRHVCSAWTTCDRFLISNLTAEILKQFPQSSIFAAPFDLDGEIVSVNNLRMVNTAAKKSESNNVLTPRLFLFDFGCLVFWNVKPEVARSVRQLASDGLHQVNSYDPAISLQENDSIPFVKDGSIIVPKIDKEVIHFPSELSLQDTILYQFAYSNRY